MKTRIATVFLCGFALLAGGPRSSLGQAVVSAPEVTYPVPSSVSLEIAVSGLGGASIYAYQFALYYDPFVMVLDKFETSGTLAAGRFAVVNFSDTGVARVAVAGGGGATADGVMIRLVGRTIAAGHSDLEFRGSAVLNGGNPAVSERPGSLTSGSGVAVESSDLPHQRFLAPYPNPASDELTFPGMFPSGSEATLNLYDMTGRGVLRQIVPADEGSVRVSLAGVPAGRYGYVLAVGKDLRRGIVFVR